MHTSAFALDFRSTEPGAGGRPLARYSRGGHHLHRPVAGDALHPLEQLPERQAGRQGRAPPAHARPCGKGPSWGASWGCSPSARGCLRGRSGSRLPAPRSPRAPSLSEPQCPRLQHKAWSPPARGGRAAHSVPAPAPSLGSGIRPPESRVPWRQLQPAPAHLLKPAAPSGS